MENPFVFYNQKQDHHASPAFAKLTAKTLPKMTVASLPPAGRIYRAYYFAGAQRVAALAPDASTGVRERYPQGFGADKVSYLLSDHLGSTSVTANTDGNLLSRTLYSAWGEVRYASGALPTDYTYTGQYSNTADFGLMYYRARWYDPSLGRFSQADTIVPGAMAIDFDRYAYVRNCPLRYTDPSGHGYCDSEHGEADVCENVDVVSLTHTGDPLPDDMVRKFGGYDAYETFLKYQETCGWWNDNCAATFGLNEFLGMWILFESGGDPVKAKALAIVVAQNLYNGGWNEATCHIQLCINGAFNFMAAYSSGQGPLFDGPDSEAVQMYVLNRDKNFSPKGIFNGAADVRDRISALGSLALTRRYVESYSRYSGPSNWGNIKGTNSYRDYQIPEYQVNGTSQYTVYYYHDNFVVLTVSQSLYWAGKGVDMSFYIP